MRFTSWAYIMKEYSPSLDPSATLRWTWYIVQSCAIHSNNLPFDEHACSDTHWKDEIATELRGRLQARSASFGWIAR
jgi:hypothetical protein